MVADPVAKPLSLERTCFPKGLNELILNLSKLTSAIITGSAELKSIFPFVEKLLRSEFNKVASNL